MGCHPTAVPNTGGWVRIGNFRRYLAAFQKQCKIEHCYCGKLIVNHMRPIECHHYHWPWVILKVSYAVWNLSNSHTSGNVACIIYNMNYYYYMNYNSIIIIYTWIRKHTWLVISAIFENKGRLKIAGSRLHCKCGNIAEAVQDGPKNCYGVECGGSYVTNRYLRKICRSGLPSVSTQHFLAFMPNSSKKLTKNLLQSCCCAEGYADNSASIS